MKRKFNCQKWFDGFREISLAHCAKTKTSEINFHKQLIHQHFKCTTRMTSNERQFYNALPKLQNKCNLNILCVVKLFIYGTAVINSDKNEGYSSQLITTIYAQPNWCFFIKNSVRAVFIYSFIRKLFPVRSSSGSKWRAWSQVGHCQGRQKSTFALQLVAFSAGKSGGRPNPGLYNHENDFILQIPVP